MKTLFCLEPEKIENYEKAKANNFKGWIIHHKLETHFSNGDRRTVDLTSTELILLDAYYFRPPEELIFMKRDEHMSLHQKGHKRRGARNSFYGKHHSEKTRKHWSEIRKGRVPPNKGKKMIMIDGKRHYV